LSLKGLRALSAIGYKPRGVPSSSNSTAYAQVRCHKDPLAIGEIFQG